MKRVIWTAAAATLLVLAGCDKKGEDAKAPQATEAPRPAPAAALNPVRRPGLWSHTISVEGGQQTMSICFDEAMAREMAVVGKQMDQSTCSNQTITPAMGGWKFASTCDGGAGGQTVTEGQVKGDFNSRIEMTATTTTTGASMPQMNGTREMAMTAEWKGPCPAGSRAGDMTLPGGMKINMLDAQKGIMPGANR